MWRVGDGGVGVRAERRAGTVAVRFPFLLFLFTLLPRWSSSALTRTLCKSTRRELKNRAPNKIIAAQLDELVAADVNSAS